MTVTDIPEELLDLARQAVPTVLVEAPDALIVLADALVEKGILPPNENNYHSELEEARERSTKRAEEDNLRRTYRWAMSVLADKTPQETKPSEPVSDGSRSVRYDYWGNSIPDRTAKPTKPVDPFEDHTNVAQALKYDNLSYEKSQQRAKIFGLVIRHPKPNELFIDIDSDAQYATYLRNIDTLIRYVNVLSTVVTPSNQGGTHRHIVVTLAEPVTSIERVAMQAALGSDPMRELLSIVRIATNQPHPTLFFEKPGPTEAVPIPMTPTSPYRSLPVDSSLYDI